MSPFGRFALRVSIYSTVLAAIALDLFVIEGPLHRKVRASMPDSEESLAEARSRGVVAQVFQFEITRGQVERAVHDGLAREGRRAEDLGPDARRLLRQAALGELIDRQLLRVKAGASAEQFVVAAEETEQRLAEFRAQFADDEELERAMAGQGIGSMAELRDRITARIQQEKYASEKIAEAVVVTEEEARAWHAAHAARLQLPERIEVRHLFLRAEEREPAAARERLDEALALLAAGEREFADLAAEWSEDPLSSRHGGSLGWVSRERLPADLAAEWFDLPPGEPTIVRGAQGWHLVEVTGRRPATPLEYEELREEIFEALESVKRRRAVRDFRRALRHFEDRRVTLFPETLAGD